MKLPIKKGTTSKRVGVFIQNSSLTTGAGLSGLAWDTAGLTWYYWLESAGNVNGTQVTLATATRGTFTSGGFVEKDATNMPGFYEIGIPNAALPASGAGWCVMVLRGAANMAPVTIEIQLTDLDLQDPVRAGLTAMANAAAGASGGAVLVDGAGDTDVANAAKTAATNMETNGVKLDTTTTVALPGQGAPPVAPTYEQLFGWLYKVFRNRKAQTASLWSLYADDETTVDAKATVSDNGTTALKHEIVSGP